MKNDSTPWKFLEQYKPSHFQGQWPTLPELFRISAERHPDRRCFSIYEPDNLFFTYAEAYTAVKRTTNYLLQKGIRKGDRVALTGKNSPEWTISYLAALFAGAVVVPIDYQLKDEEIEGLIEYSDARFLFVDEERYDSLARGSSFKLKERISLSPKKDNYLLDVGVDEDMETEMPREEDLAAILYTSGTTGHQKGVMLSHKNFVSDCFLAQANMNIFHTDVFYALLPLHHSYTMLAVFIEAISVGAEIVFAKKLVVKQILKDLHQGQVTMFLGIPMLFNKILKGLMRGIREKGILVYALIRGMMYVSGFIKKTLGVNPGKKMFRGILKKVSLDTNRICICGGGPLPSSTFSMFNQLGIDFVQGYGLTETSPILTLNPVDHYKETSVGKVIPGAEMRVIDPDEEGHGELIVKGPMVMQGYYKNPEATAEVLTEDNWLRTGDVGYLDSENYLYLTGRKKSLIVTEGGKNVFPEEIEDYFQLYDEIEQILVRGYLLDEKMKTEGIEALIYPNMDAFTGDDGRSQSTREIEKRMDEIVKQVNAQLLPYKRIARIEVLEEPMEMTTTKKIKRFKVEANR
ncbi:MAG TPA: long-chain fatty acid--CoA ligase [Sediminispirochaeta sp.]|nr:long-chain fatty acid--CoA ligase [Sediminispirochaeta sp.]